MPVAIDGERHRPGLADRAGGGAGRRPRRRAHRHDREPAGRHQEPRDLRDAGGGAADGRLRRRRGAGAASATWPTPRRSWRSSTRTLVYNGLWFSPLRAGARRHSWTRPRPRVTGEARVQALQRRLRRSSGGARRRRCTTTGWPPTRRATRFQHGAAAGFIHVWSLGTKTWAAATQAAGGYSRGVTEPLWSGRLSGGLDPAILDFTASLAVDRRLLPHDLRASAVHVRMLARQGLIDAAEADADRRGAGGGRDRAGRRRRGRALGDRAAAGRPRPARARRPQPKRPGADGDAAVGEGGLRPARSTASAALALTLLDRADEDGDAVLPGYTHGQRAQPVWLGQHLAAHVWALLRDGRRLGQVREAADVCPLGAGALAGSSLPLDPAWAAERAGLRQQLRELARRRRRPRLPGRARATPAALCLVHLSRLGEELVLWTSAEYGFAELDDRAATGSSMMPQKKNPDAAELARGKAGTAIGRLAGLLATLKGLPLAYNRDLQEDKRASFDQVDDLVGALGRWRCACAGLRFDRARMADGGQRRPHRRHRRGRAAGARGRAVPRGALEVAARVAAGERFAAPGAAEAAAARLPPRRWRRSWRVRARRCRRCERACCWAGWRRAPSWPSGSARRCTSIDEADAARARPRLSGRAGQLSGRSRVVYACKANATVAVLRALAERGAGRRRRLRRRAGGGTSGRRRPGGDRRARQQQVGGRPGLCDRAGAGWWWPTTPASSTASSGWRREAGRVQRVLVRVTPGIEADTHRKIMTGHHGSKFGLAPADALDALDAARAAAPAAGRAARAPGLADPRTRHLHRARSTG